MIRDVIMPRLKDIGADDKKELAIIINSYIDRNHEKLKTMNITERNFFQVEDKEVIYGLCNTNEDEINSLMKNSKEIDSTRRVMAGASFGITCCILISHFLREKDEQMAYAVQLYMMLDLYGYIHKKYAKFGAKEAVMAYTVAKMSNSFDLKKEGSMYAVLQRSAKDLLTTYKTRIIRCDDADIEYFFRATFSRINGKMRKIFNHYYANEKSGKYLNLDTESYKEDEFRVADSDSKVIFNLVDKVYINFINNKVDERVPEYAVMGSDLSVEKFRNLMTDIRFNCTDIEVRTLLSNIVGYATSYSNLTLDKISSGEFIVTCKKGYASNTISPQMEEVKKVLAKWVDDNSMKHGRQAYGKTASNNYKRSVYMYFVYAIFNEAK